MKVIIADRGDIRIIADVCSAYQKVTHTGCVTIVMEGADHQGAEVCRLPFKAVPEYDEKGNESFPDPSLGRAHRIVDVVLLALDTYMCRETSYPLSINKEKAYAVKFVDKEGSNE